MRVPKVPHLSRVKRPVRIAIGVALTTLAVAYILLKIDVHQTWDVLKSADLWWFALACTIMIVTVVPMALRWKWLLAAQAIRDHLPWLTRSYFVSYTAGQILPTSIGGDAVRIFESAKRHPGRSGDLTAIVLARAGARRRRHGAARRGRLRARARPLRRQRVPVARGSVRLRDDPPHRAVLLALGAPAARPRAPPARPAPARAPATRVLRRHPPLPGPSGAAAEGVPVHDRDPGGANPRDLGLVQGSRDRARPAHLLRDGAAVLPRPARAVHAQRVRGAGGVLRQLPRLGRRRRRPGVRGGLPLLPRHGRSRAARSGDPALGIGAQAGGSPRSNMAEAAQPSSSPRTTHCRGSSSVSRASPVRRPSSSTTPRATARSRSCASASPACAWSSRRTSVSLPAGRGVSRRSPRAAGR